ncbi:mycofactocin precursor MftA [Actinomadura sediminis]|uniref:Mycofactocin MftA n=1 Tax=Actinomadura sediminis TaxID=1038904 RepID=A0ABW3EY81_9ACTN
MDSAATEDQNAAERTEDAVAAESLIEEVSIDGMCGVY